MVAAATAAAAADAVAGTAGVASGYSGRAWLRTLAASIAPSSPIPPFEGKSEASFAFDGARIFAAAKPAAGLTFEGAGNFAGDGFSCFAARGTEPGLALDCEGCFPGEGPATAAAARSAAVIGATTGATGFFDFLPFGCRDGAGNGPLTTDGGARSYADTAAAGPVADRFSGLPLGCLAATEDRGGFLTYLFLTMGGRGVAGTGFASTDDREKSLAAAVVVVAANRRETLDGGFIASNVFGAAVLAAAGPALADRRFVGFPKIST